MTHPTFPAIPFDLGADDVPETQWLWLDRAVEAGLACRVGKGTRVDPCRYALPAGRAGA